MHKCVKMGFSVGIRSAVFAAFAALAALPARALDAQPPYHLTFVEYIESDSAKLAYINTGYVPNANTEIEMEFAFTTTSPTNKTYVFGEYGNGGGRFQFSYGPDNCMFGFGGDNNYDGGIVGFAFNTERHVVKYVRNDGFYFDGTKVVAKDGVDLVTWGGTGVNLYLGALNPKGVLKNLNKELIAPLRIYSCKIWDDGVLVRNFMPARTDKSEGVLYETVRRKVHHNANTSSNNPGSFSAGGNEVQVTTDYRKADYIETTNRTAFINTEYVPNANTELEMSFAFTSILTNKTYVFGSYGPSKGRFQFSYGPDGNVFGYGAGYDNAVVGLVYNTERHVIKYVRSPSKGFYFDNIFVNNNTGTNLTTWAGTGANLFLGQVNPNDQDKLNPTNLAPIRIYSCKIWEGNELKRDLVPRQRTFDNKNGLYDKVTGSFYTYYGTGADFAAELSPLGGIIIFR